ncbi:helix-turn-helix transcriptional regulator [Inhella sp.]|uniref:helix-turn-helix transcriptional regulator n=1 Tax=Inhella sp. TaxID=1921806 RepID=UPI0035B28EE8
MPQKQPPESAIPQNAQTLRRLLREAEVLRLTSLSRTPLRNAIARGQFPQPIKLTPTRCIAFDAAEVDAWIEARSAERHKSEGK